MRGGDRQQKTPISNFSPRLSLGEISGQKLAFGLVKDVLISTTWESNNDDFSSFDNFLYGVGFDLAIPYFQYANVNFYRASNENTVDDYQMTIAYALPFKLSNEDFLVDGFLTGLTGGKIMPSEPNWTTQYKWNVGKTYFT